MTQKLFPVMLRTEWEEQLNVELPVPFRRRFWPHSLKMSVGILLTFREWGQNRYAPYHEQNVLTTERASNHLFMMRKRQVERIDTMPDEQKVSAFAHDPCCFVKRCRYCLYLDSFCTTPFLEIQPVDMLKLLPGQIKCPSFVSSAKMAVRYSAICPSRSLFLYSPFIYS